MSEASTSSSSSRPRRPRSAPCCGLTAITCNPVFLIARRYTSPLSQGLGNHVRAYLPRRDPDPEPLLGGAGLRAGAAARHRGGRRHVPPDDLPAVTRTGALGCRLRAALP